MICSLATTLILQLVLLITRSFLERLALLVVHLAVAVARHDRALLTEVAAILLGGTLGLASFPARLIMLEVVDLLVLGVGGANSLLSVSNAVLKKYVGGLSPIRPAADSRRDT